MAGQLLFDICGFSRVWVGFDMESTSSSTVGWVGSVCYLVGWPGLGWDDKNRPIDDSRLFTNFNNFQWPSIVYSMRKASTGADGPVR